MPPATTGNDAGIKGLIADPLSLLRSRLYTNTAYLWLAVGGFALLGFAFWTTVARLYSPEAMGLGGAAVNAMMVLAQIAQLGLGYALIRFIPQSGDEALHLLSRSMTATVLASLLIGSVFLVSLPLWSQELKDLLWHPLNIVSFLAFAAFIAVGFLLRSIFVAYQRSVFVLGLNLIIGATRIPVVVLLAGIGSAMGIVAGIGLALPGAILLAVLIFLPRCTGRLRLPLALDLWRLAPVVPFALSNLTSHVLTVMIWQLLPLVVISLAGAESAGYFFVAWAVSGLFLVLSQQLALALFAQGSHESGGFGAQARGALLVGVVLGGSFAVAAFLLGDLVLRLFGVEYAERSGTVLKLLAASSPLAAVTNIYLGIERVRGRMVNLVAVSGVVAVVTLGVTIGTVPRLGIEGAGYGVLAGYGAGALLSLALLYPMLPLRTVSSNVE